MPWRQIYQTHCPTLNRLSGRNRLATRSIWPIPIGFSHIMTHPQGPRYWIICEKYPRYHFLQVGISAVGQILLDRGGEVGHPVIAFKRRVCFIIVIAFMQVIVIGWNMWIAKLGNGGFCNIGYPTETQLKLKSREVSFVHNFVLCCSIVLKCYSEHGSDTTMRCATFQNDRTTEKYVVRKRDFTRFEFEVSFGGGIADCNSPQLTRLSYRSVLGPRNPILCPGPQHGHAPVNLPTIPNNS